MIRRVIRITGRNDDWLVPMPGYSQCEFFLLRYVPDAVKNEFVNVGVVLIESDQNRPEAYAGVRFTSDWRRVRCLDPHADTEMLSALEEDIRARLQATPEQRWELLRRIQDSLSNVLQVTEPKACLTDRPADELAELATRYLESLPRVPRADTIAAGRSRRVVLQAMQRAFSDAGVWPLMQKNIAVAKYMYSADPLKIDCGYHNGMVRMFQAITLDSDAASAKVLAFSFPELRAGIHREHGKSAELTAVIGEDYGEDEEGVRFSKNILRRSEIEVATTAELGALADRARRELRV